MKQYFMQLFEIEEGEYSAKEFLAAGGSLLVALSFISMPLFV